MTAMERLANRSKERVNPGDAGARRLVNRSNSKGILGELPPQSKGSNQNVLGNGNLSGIGADAPGGINSPPRFGRKRTLSR